MAASVDLSSAQRSVLIELYHTHSVLWDNSLTYYKDQGARNKALASIQISFLQKCGIQLEISDLKSKLQNFRSAVAREMAKQANVIRSCGGSDEKFYRPSFQHWNELQFLVRVIKKRESKPNLVDGQQLPQMQLMPDESAEDGNRTVHWLTEASQGSEVSLSPSSSSVEDQQTVSQSQASQPSTPHQGGREQQTSPVSKRKAENHAGMEGSNSYFKPKAPKMHMNANDNATDGMMIWAKSLVNDLNYIKNENKRKLLQIRINRLVHDEIEKQIETEMEQEQGL